jgi:2-dehydro-3-deoxygalactonokinase
MTHFFSCDWGTTSFRLRRVDAITSEVLAEQREASGVKQLLAICPANDPSAREQAYASFLRAHLLSLASGTPASLHGVPVMISGMASSSVGWRELPYAQVPVDLDGSTLVQEHFALAITERAQAHVHLISGVRTENDILRGEETEIVGVFAGGRFRELADNGIALLPGTHSKHVRLRAGKMIGFHTYMTGELFDVLATHSLLRASVSAPESSASSSLIEPQSRQAFAAGVQHASKSGLAAALFQTRVRTVLQNIRPGVNRWFLSGLLIGAETVDLARRELGVPILLAAPEPLRTAYRLAFETLGLEQRLSVASAEEIALASVRGHWALLHRNQPSTTGCYLAGSSDGRDAGKRPNEGVAQASSEL